MTDSLLARWERRFHERGELPARPAATVVVLSEDPAGRLQTLLLHRSSDISFGDMWVFPGGRIDPEDHHGANDMLDAARSAAVREAREEATIEVDPAQLVYFAHWVPDRLVEVRYATWFFAVRVRDREVVVDDEEIVQHRWMAPQDALARRDAGEIALAPPTWVTLHMLGRFDDADSALSWLAARPPQPFVTRVVRGRDGPVALWSDDAAYTDGDLSRPGRRHRLVMTESGYDYDDSGRVESVTRDDPGDPR